MSLLPIEGFTNLDFQEVSPENGPLIAVAKTSAVSTAAGFYPLNDTPSSGDIWIGTKYPNFDNPLLGKYYAFTTMHELGHALGLKHGHEARTSSEVALPADMDTIEYSVMTYRSYLGAEVTGSYLTDPYSFPQTYMMGDIAALQRMYGANYTFRSTDTTYTWKPDTGETFVDGEGQGVPGDTKDLARSNKIFLTIWDGGGNDTYDLSLYETDLQVDLRPGASSLFNTGQLAQLDYRNTDHPARGNVFNALLYNDDTRSLIENVIGGKGNDTIVGNIADNHLSGRDGNDSMDGGQGNDVFDGGLGADTMVGGAGNDTFMVDDLGDRISDISGNDTVLSSISYTLGTSIENLTATGLAGLALAGNGLSNVLTGNGASNRLSGYGGNDVLDGGGGADTMMGGTGNDTYYVNTSRDVIVEFSGSGTDRVFTSVSYSLSKYVENLIATGTSKITLTGNESNNALTGNATANVLRGGLGHDTLNGGAGIDRLEGGIGSDTYYVDNAKDVVIEASNGGKDKVYTTVSYRLASHIETLIATGTGAVSLTGNGANNAMTGNSAANRLSGLDGNDRLNGGFGNDRLAGGKGQDLFIFSTKLDARSNVDTIADFLIEDDTICLENAIFTKLGKAGALKDAFFRIGSKAMDANDYLIYNSKTGALFYDADGSGKAAAAVQFAWLKTKLALTAEDFLVV
ncbi:M10 family metallopeptidase [Microvirga solisilvae]|uniref:M10 family metallopeptidase n=1 Tax=Microvirga solisilvae TaxID=2919498 RepID=UPI001FAF04BE|nr:M10 family metallopeptidase [Microvirga solisilvae]